MIINTPAPGALLYSMWGNEDNEVHTKFVYWSIIHQRVLNKFTIYQQTEFTLSKLTANGNLGNLLSATLQGCLAHVYMYAILVPNLIWKHFFFTSVGICCYHGNTHSITVKKKCVLHIYTSRPTSVPTFIWNALFSPIFGIMCHYHGNTFSVTFKNVPCTSTLQDQSVCQN